MSGTVGHKPSIERQTEHVIDDINGHPEVENK